jgi:hypothetical protein
VRASVPEGSDMAVNVDKQQVHAIDGATDEVALPEIIKTDHCFPNTHPLLCAAAQDAAAADAPCFPSLAYSIPERRSNDSRLLLASDAISLIDAEFVAKPHMRLPSLAVAESARGAHLAIHR